MAFPPSWPPRYPSTSRTLRFYVTDTATANFADKAYMFAEQTTANPYTPLPVVQPGSNAVVVVPNTAGSGLATPTSTGAEGPVAQIWSSYIRISVSGAVLEYSFDGTTVHGQILAGESFLYYERRESGIAVRGAGAAFRIEAW